MCSMDSTLCTPIHEMYVVSVPTREMPVARVYRGMIRGFPFDMKSSSFQSDPQTQSAED